jgi:urease accessory protein
MYASALRSDPSPTAALPLPPARQRAQGRVALSVARLGTTTRPVRIAESGASRVRLPRAAGAALEGVLINTAGGVACGDRFEVEAAVGPGADLVLATPAAEKVYRSDGDTAEIAIRATVDAGAGLAWLPQETILFDTARLRRRFDAELAADARLLLFESVVFGRSAFGEEVASGFFEDRWRIHRAGRLVYADMLRLSGPIAAQLSRPAIAGGARALATVLYVAPDTEARLHRARELLDGSGCASACSAWNGLLAVRFLAHDAAALRASAIRFIEALRGPLPRVWRS